MAVEENQDMDDVLADPLKLVDQSLEEDIRKECSSTNLLVVDDEEIVRNMLVNVLTKEGYSALGFGQAEDVLEKIAEGKADIVITDLKMDKIGGIELLKKVKDIDPSIDVIVITGYASVETAVESMKLGAVDYLTKPLNIDHVRIIVKKTLERRILKRKAVEALFYRRLSRIDGMTELFNYRFFQDLLRIEIARAKRESWPVSLIMLDIDDFKVFNDKNGHPMGDVALKEVACILRSKSRDCDFVARYGGEEFVVIAPHLDKKNAEGLAARIRKAVEKTRFENEEVLPQGRFTITGGVAEFPSDASTKEELVEKADQALYQAKKDGKNKIRLYSTL
jgi:diguanylate cyclase (GGDEF)-like protein